MANIFNELNESPIISAVKDDETLKASYDCPSKVVFVLFGNINNIKDIVSSLKEHNKTVFVHADLIEGLSAKEASIDYLMNNTKLDGIISTKLFLIRYAKSKGLATILRFFVIDSLSLQKASLIKNEKCVDMIEILPGLMTKIIKKMKAETGKSIIAGGLIDEKADIINALHSGAVAVSSTNTAVWNM